MAIAPVNKFVSIAVPVAPGLQKLYEVPTGTSALLLYTQVANVGIGTTYPTVTFTQKRTSRSTGNTRDIRVVKDAEIPPNDAVILVDGRLVLEKTPLVLDQIYIQAKRYSDNSVGRPTIQSFVGAMTGGGFRKGVFVTSSSFTSEAIEFAKGRRDQRLILIDGVDLAKLMIEHSVGVQVKEVIKVSKIDQDFFSDDES